MIVQSLDFPLLASDGGHTLEHELGVKSNLHQEQLTRALKRVILGIGTPPSPPQVIEYRPQACQYCTDGLFLDACTVQT